MNELFQPAMVPITGVHGSQDDAHTTYAKIEALNAALPNVEYTADACIERPELTAWSSMIQSLTGEVYQPKVACYNPGDRRRLKRAGRQDGPESFSHAACVAVLERPSASSALVSWRDSTLCSYGFQLWHRSVSRRSGICALSGCEIRRGDSVYQPRSHPRPLNACAMILSSHIESACPP
jgi:hypothetical protein